MGVDSTRTICTVLREIPYGADESGVVPLRIPVPYILRKDHEDPRA